MVEFLATTLYVGAKHGLTGPTAVCRWRMPPDMEDALTQGQMALLQKKSHLLWPADPLSGVSQEDWPHAFLREPQPGSLNHWAVALTVAILRHAREPAYVGRVLSVTHQEVQVALPYARHGVWVQAMRFAWAFLDLWLGEERQNGPSEQALKTKLAAWLGAVQPKGLAPNTLRFALAAYRVGIPVSWDLGVLRLGWGGHAELVDSSFTGRTSTLGTRRARNKHMTSAILRRALVPVPVQRVVSSFEQAMEFVAKVGWPVVVKPTNQDQGNGVVPAIQDEGVLKKAFDAAAVYSPGAVIVEQHVDGHDHRMLIVGGKLLMTTLRVPGGVLGDGTKNVAELVNDVNADLRRGTNKRSLMKRLLLDEEAVDCLQVQGLTFTSVPQAGRRIQLRKTANISTGGTAVDVTLVVHPDNALVAERAARALGLDIAGVDFLCPDIRKSWREVGGAVCEVNAQPGFRVHWLGDPERDINGEVLDWLFRGKPSRIPTAAITGTNGKSTVARMLHHIWQTAGRVTGVCTTHGVWVGNALVSDRNLSGFPGARVLLEDPAVEAAVFEMPRKGLLQFGHACDRYDVAALLNVQDDHIGVDGIRSLQEMACLKAEVLERAAKAVVINAEDALCLAMAERAGTARRVLVARNALVPAVQTHRAAGGEATVVQLHHGQPWIVLAEGAAQTPLMPLHDVPATMLGLLRFNESNALFAVALAWSQGLPPDTIRAAMAGFHNSPEHNPGRYNFIEGLPFQVLLDYGHNPDGVRELCALVQKLPVPGQRHLLSLKIGNRHLAHFEVLAPLLRQTFARFVLGCDAAYAHHCKDYEGEDPVQKMLQTTCQLLVQAGVDQADIQTEADQAKAVRVALAQAQAGDLVVLLAEPWLALPILRASVKSHQCS